MRACVKYENKVFLIFAYYRDFVSHCILFYGDGFEGFFFVGNIVAK